MQTQFTPLTNQLSICYSLQQTRGSFGSVYHGRHNQIGQCCIKLYRNRFYILEQKYSSQRENFYFHEQNIMKNSVHPNIVRTYQVGQDRKNYFVVMQKCDCSLQKLMSAKQYERRKNKLQYIFSQQEAIYIIIQVCKGLRYMKSKNILHLNLKPHNIQFKDGKIKVGDFGLLQQNDKVQMYNYAKASTNLYRPYQALKFRCYTQICDVWGVGCMFYWMLQEELPWRDMSKYNVEKNGKKLELKRKDISERSRAFLNECTKIHDRCGWEELFQRQKQFLEQEEKVMHVKEGLEKSRKSYTRQIELEDFQEKMRSIGR